MNNYDRTAILFLAVAFRWQLVLENREFAGIITGIIFVIGCGFLLYSTEKEQTKK